MAGLVTTLQLRRRSFYRVALCCAVMACVLMHTLAANAEPRWRADRLLVKVKKGVAKADRERSLMDAEGVESETIPHIEYRVVKVRPDRLEHALGKLRNDPNVEVVEMDFLGEQTFVPNDPRYLDGSEWHLATVQAAQAWDITLGDSNIVVAVIDSGIDPRQTDLTGQLLTGFNCFDNSSNVDDTVNGHGTITAGIVGAAANNGKGVAGLAPGCRVLPIKALDSTGFISWSDAAKGIIYAADHGAKVINMSFCGPVSSSTLQSAVEYAWSKGIVLVAAAGNYGNNTIQYPAAYPQVVGVSATESDDTLCSFSSFGSYVSLAAPGGGVWSTLMNGAYGPSWGTSMSSPVVAAVFGLVLSVNNSLSNADAVNLVESNADDLGSLGYDTHFGYGRVNAYKAVAAAASVPAIPDTTAPTATVDSPAAASIVSNTVSIQITTSDDRGVTMVEWYMDGALQSSSATSSAEFNWNTTLFTNGSHMLTAKAYDAAGNVGTSSSVSVDVENQAVSQPPPSKFAEIVWPIDGSTVMTKKQKVIVSLADRTAVSEVRFLVDGQWVATRSRIPIAFGWKARNALPGNHTLEAIAVDATGKELATTSVVVTKPAPVPPSK